jgi:hypothetical protein
VGDGRGQSLHLGDELVSLLEQAVELGEGHDRVRLEEAEHPLDLGQVGAEDRRVDPELAPVVLLAVGGHAYRSFTPHA